MSEHDLIVALSGMFVKSSLQSNFQKCQRILEHIPDGSAEHFCIHVMFHLAELGEMSRDLEFDFEQFFYQIETKKIKDDYKHV